MPKTALPLLLGTLLLGGCHTTPWVRGEVTPALPRWTVKAEPGTVFYVKKTEPRVQRTLVEALMARGFAVTDEPARADVILETAVELWETNDRGFGGGAGSRDDMVLSVKLVNAHTRRVAGHFSVSVRSDFRILHELVAEF